MKIQSWQPVLTDHQSYTLEALRKAADAELVVHVCDIEDAVRKAQGWVSSHSESLSPRRLPRHGWFMYVWHYLRRNRDAIHIFGSPFQEARLIATLVLALAMRLKVYIISEPYSPLAVAYLTNDAGVRNGLRALLRPLLYRVYGLIVRRRLSGVFAISCLAVAQYTHIGVPTERIHPFGYFIPRDLTAARVVVPKREPGTPVRAIMVGALIARKGLDIAVDAMRVLRDAGVPIRLDVFGPGDPLRYGFDGDVVVYRGRLPFGTAQQVIADYDVLVVPSRFDGWGVVINEALLAGVPVVCSDRVGASVLLRRWGCGATYPGEQAAALGAQLRQICADPSWLEAMSAAARRAAGSLDPAIAGRYMLEVITASLSGSIAKPPSPWYECTE